jgi:hypothetical protein
MKYTILVIGVLCVGCQSSSWDKNEILAFNNDCIEAEQTAETCHCLLRCLMQEYTSYRLAGKKIASQNMSEELNVCIEICKQHIK